MFFNLPVSNNFLLLKQLLKAVFLISLLTFLLFLLRPDVFKIFKIALFLFGFGDLVLLHLLLKFHTDAHLVLFDLHLDGILFFLELFNVVHYDLCPVVTVLNWRSDVTTWTQDLVPYFLDGGGARSLRSMRKGL